MDLKIILTTIPVPLPVPSDHVSWKWCAYAEISSRTRNFIGMVTIFDIRFPN
jgi:hypothetical protein